MEPKEQGYWQPEQPSTDASQMPDAAPVADEHPMMQAVSWEASEYVHHEKNMLWYVYLGLVGLALLLLSLFIIKALTFTILIVVMIAAVVYMAARPPRVMHYQLTSKGIEINENSYHYNDFRSFGVVQDGSLYYITLLPIKRFMPSIDIYFPPENGEQIIDLLGSHIAMQTVKLDFIDRLTRQLRF